MAYSDHCKQLLDKLNKQREGGFLCDCTILIGDFQYKAHRNVLASFSEYFGALFKDALDCIILLDQKQVTPAGFQTMLDFIYSGNLNFDRCNIEEICKAAEYLRLEKVALTCRTKMDSVMLEKTFVTELPLTEASQDTNEQSAFPHLQGTNKTEVICSAKKIVSIKASRSKKWKRKMRSHQKVQKNVAEQQNPVSIAPPDLSLDINGLTEALVGPVTQEKDNGSLPLITALNSESLLMEESVAQSACMKRKHVKLQQNGALKEHCMANIVSANNVCKMDGLVKGLEQKYFKNKPTCNTCGKIFSEASSLRRHMRIHKGVKPYVCHLCGKAFTQCNQLKTHVRTHTGEKPYQCKLCDKGFAQKCQLVFHSRMHHGEEKPYKCDVCNLQFATSSNLKIHARKHSGEKPYVCDRCGQRFAQASTLTYHVRRHTGEKPYVCDTCGKAFAVSSSLITHARKHTGEKPYICGVCGKSFISSGELNKHFRSHTGERPFVCEVCGNSYTDVKNLKKHKLKIHSGSEDADETDAIDDTHNEEDTEQKSPEADNLDLKPSELFLPLTLHIGPEDHQMLLPVTDNQCLSSETLLRTSANSYSEPQYIFLQQMY
ncbi:myoneurin [Pseudophryne corroboree]|uniref:myoneurin n=1 Tax=Pseudophryne corroboree TaxID=495146 RepID=UPI003082019B